MTALHSIRHRVACLVPVLLLLVTTTGPALGQDAVNDVVAGYADAFLADDGDALVAFHDAAMRRAMTATQAAGLRGALEAQQGACLGRGDPWQEDTVGTLRRFRVPLRYENGTLDMRVVVDAGDKVAGLFFVAHVPQPEPAVAPVREERVVLGEDPYPLPGTFSLPDGEPPFPAVVLVHGSGPNDRDETLGLNKPFRDLAWGLGERGVATLRYDKRSFTHPTDLVASGAALTVKEEVIDDALVALAWLRARDDVTHVFVVGHSLGGHLAPRIAAIEPRPDGFVSLAGSTLPLPEKVIEQSTYIAMVDGTLTDAEQAQLDGLTTMAETLRADLSADPPVTDGGFLGAPIGYYRDLEAHDVPALAAALELPALIVQGGRDYQVTLEDFAGWQAALSDTPFACLVVYADLDHLLRAGSGPSTPASYETPGAVDEQLIADLAAWITEGRCPEGR